MVLCKAYELSSIWNRIAVVNTLTGSCDVEFHINHSGFHEDIGTSDNRDRLKRCGHGIHQHTPVRVESVPVVRGITVLAIANVNVKNLLQPHPTRTLATACEYGCVVMLHYTHT